MLIFTRTGINNTSFANPSLTNSYIQPFNPDKPFEDSFGIINVFALRTTFGATVSVPVKLYVTSDTSTFDGVNVSSVNWYEYGTYTSNTTAPNTSGAFTVTGLQGIKGVRLQHLDTAAVFRMDIAVYPLPYALV